MIQITKPEDQVLIEFLCDRVQQLQRQLDEISDAARAGREAQRRPTVYTGQSIYWAQVTVAIPAAYNGASPAGGTVRLAIISPPGGTARKWYMRYPHIDVPNIVNGTGGSVSLYTLVLITMVDGLWTVIEADCANVFTTMLPDQPH
jgi:hypothetical protein